MNIVEKSTELNASQAKFLFTYHSPHFPQQVGMTENKKFRNSKTRWFWNQKLEMRFVQNVLSTY